MKERKLTTKWKEMMSEKETDLGSHGRKTYDSTIICHPISVALTLLLPLLSILICCIPNICNVTNLISPYNAGNLGDNNNYQKGTKLDNLIRWVQEQGGYVHSAVTIDVFPAYGGYGLKTFAAIHEHDILLRIPVSIVISLESWTDRYRSIITAYATNTKRQSRTTDFITFLTQSLHNAESEDDSSLVYQDWAIAMALMIECSLGEQSSFYPFLDVLPNEVPRLDTFSEEELEMLQDNYLSSLARHSRNTLRHVWNADVHDLVQLIMKSIKNKMTKNINMDATCLTFEAFHRYTAISSSRAMILSGRKYFTPLADMINYAPKQNANDESTKEKVSSQGANSFLRYHHLDESGQSIIVKADRDVMPSHQIFEDYGPTDNSLFLEAFGFVPSHNPSHCALIELPPPNSRKTMDILHHLNLATFGPDGQMVYNNNNGACVLMDGSFTPHHSKAYLAVIALERKEELRQVANRCWNTVNNSDIRTDIQDLVKDCIYYPGHQPVVYEHLREAAQKALERSLTTLDFDLSLLNNSTEMSTRAVIALQFRIAEKRLLTDIANGNYSPNTALF